MSPNEKKKRMHITKRNEKNDSIWQKPSFNIYSLLFTSFCLPLIVHKHQMHYNHIQFFNTLYVIITNIFFTTFNTLSSSIKTFKCCSRWNRCCLLCHVELKPQTKRTGLNKVCRDVRWSLTTLINILVQHKYGLYHMYVISDRHLC